MFYKVYNKIKAFFLIFLAILLVFSLVSYSQTDQSFNVSTSSYPLNIFGYFGSYLADILYQLFGITSFIIPFSFITWSYFVFKEKITTRTSFRIIFLMIAICSSSISSSNLKLTYFPAGGGGVLGVFLLYILNKYLYSSKQVILFFSFICSILFFSLALGIKFTFYIKFYLYLKDILVKVVLLPKIFGSYIKKFLNFSKLQSSSQKKKYIIDRNLSITKAKGINPNVSHKSLVFMNSQVNRNKSTLPSTDFLDEPNNKNTISSFIELEKTADNLLKVLVRFGVNGKIVNIKQGPVVTSYEFKAVSGTNFSRVIGLSDDISRSLSTYSTRIAIIPEKNLLSIELPNKERNIFCFKEFIETNEFRDPNRLLPIILGKDLNGQVLLIDLIKMPNLLIAGKSRSGKSNFINAIIMSLFYKYSQNECKIVMINTKMLEFSFYNNVPHIINHVISKPIEAINMLKWVIREMENRYRLMSYLQVKNIITFNKKIVEAIELGISLERKIQTGFDIKTGKALFKSIPINMEIIPFIIVVIDKIADLIIKGSKDIENSIERLVPMASNAGIHIIIVTETVSPDVINETIKANFSNRISFKLESKIHSKIILGQQGAEQLLETGDMLYMGNNNKIIRVHGVFVHNKEIEKVTTFLKSTVISKECSVN